LSQVFPERPLPGEKGGNAGDGRKAGFVESALCADGSPGNTCRLGNANKEADFSTGNRGNPDSSGFSVLSVRSCSKLLCD
jgi:hypothetical protein